MTREGSLFKLEFEYDLPRERLTGNKCKKSERDKMLKCLRTSKSNIIKEIKKKLIFYLKNKYLSFLLLLS